MNLETRAYSKASKRCDLDEMLARIRPMLGKFRPGPSPKQARRRRGERGFPRPRCKRDAKLAALRSVPLPLAAKASGHCRLFDLTCLHLPSFRRSPVVTTTAGSGVNPFMCRWLRICLSIFVPSPPPEPSRTESRVFGGGDKRPFLCRRRRFAERIGAAFAHICLPFSPSAGTPRTHT